jgi:hypothetical protein
MNQQELAGLGFTRIAEIRVSDDGVLKFVSQDDRVREEGRVGWVYVWVQTDSTGSRFEVVYAGKAGGPIWTRCKQHQRGFTDSSTGRKNASKIREYLSGDRAHRFAVYARSSGCMSLFGQVNVSMCEIEERALIIRLIAADLPIWNYEANRGRRRRGIGQQDEELAVETAMAAETDDETLDAEEGVMTADEAFFASLSSSQDAQTLCGRLTVELYDRPGVEVYHTFTRGGDLRVACSVPGRRRTVVANASWQPLNNRFVMTQYLPAADCPSGVECQDLTGLAYVPRTVRSRGFYSIPDQGQSLIDAVLMSIDQFMRDNS